MTALVGCFGPLARAIDDEVLARAFAAMPDRSDAQFVVLRSPGCVLAVARHPWETAAGLSGPFAVSQKGRLSVISDAALYYLDDLARSIGVSPESLSKANPSGVISEALLVGGHAAIGRLEGDFAFVSWDGDTAIMARDFAGSRPLFYALVGDSLVVASRVSGVLAFPGVGRDLNPVVIAEIAASQFAYPYDTAFRGVEAVAAGDTVLWSGVRQVHREAHWNPPEFLSEGRPVLDEGAAAETLRELLVRASAERARGQRIVASHLSGGWDSTAVLAAATRAVSRQSDRRIVGVSADFPPGDSGHETPHVAATQQMLGVEVTRIQGLDAPFDVNGLARPHPDDPFNHVFAGFNIGLATAASEAGARVVFTGWGGDQLFAVGLGYLADLFVLGRWPEAWREFRSFGGKKVRHLVSAAVVPSLPDLFRIPLARLLGASRDRHMERAVPDWLSHDFVKSYGVVARQNRHLAEARGRTFSNFETRTLVAHPYFPRIYAELAEIHLGCGVEVRSPLFDRRVIEFAATRPRRERTSMGETKRLLRMAMREDLPSSVLAPRATRTGTLDTYLAQSFARHRGLLEELASGIRLESMGIVDPTAFKKSVNLALDSPTTAGGLEMVHALQVEHWLRSYRTENLI